jgi:predicted nucleic acid-binding protein
MAGQYPQPVFLDATVLSDFASTAAIEFLVDLLESPTVAPAVRDETEQGRSAGHDYLDVAVDAFDEGLAVTDIPPEAGETDIRDRLDAGEAESLLGAIEHGGTLATDDLTARRLADDRSVPVTGSIGLLVLGVERGLIDRETADAWLDTWREERGYYAPVESVGDVLEDE